MSPTESPKYGDWCALLFDVKGNPPEKASAMSVISRTQRDSAQHSCGKTPSLVLSDDLVMVYVLRDSGCVGRFTSGRVERTGSGLNFYDRGGGLVEYFSETKIRSWCVFGSFEGWVRSDARRLAKNFLAVVRHLKRRGVGKAPLRLTDDGGAAKGAFLMIYVNTFSQAEPWAATSRRMRRAVRIYGER